MAGILPTQTASSTLTGLARARLEHRIPSGPGRESVVEDERLVGLPGEESQRMVKGQKARQNCRDRHKWVKVPVQPGQRKAENCRQVLHERAKNNLEEEDCDTVT